MPQTDANGPMKCEKESASWDSGPVFWHSEREKIAGQTADRCWIGPVAQLADTLPRYVGPFVTIGCAWTIIRPSLHSMTCSERDEYDPQPSNCQKQTGPKSDGKIKLQ